MKSKNNKYLWYGGMFLNVRVNLIFLYLISMLSMANLINLRCSNPLLPKELYMEVSLKF
jgi:hypothetical protein